MNKAMARSVTNPANKPTLEISINTSGVNLSKELRSAVSRKIGRVVKYAPDAIRAVVDIQLITNKKSTEQFRVFVRYEIPGYDLTAEHRAHEPLTALDLVAEKIERRLRKRKTAFLASRSGRHGRPVRIAEFCVPPQFSITPRVNAGVAI